MTMNNNDNGQITVHNHEDFEQEQQYAMVNCLINDPNGLCLLSKGSMMANNNNTGSSNRGVYTSLTRLASTLIPSINNDDNTAHSTPLVTIEMEGTSSILIKEYDGHTVAMKVPNKVKHNHQ